MNVEHRTSNIERRRKSCGCIRRANLPVEIYRTERPLGRFLRRLKEAALPAKTTGYERRRFQNPNTLPK
ncbi:MAG: hypothetical protein ACOC4K_00420 [Verrucomicrobiota bacterium]